MEREQLAATALAANSAVVAEVSTRIYADLAPNGARVPYIVYSLASGVSDTLLEGGRSSDVLRIQIDCYATSRAAAIALGELACTAMETIGEKIGNNPGARDALSNLYRDSADYSVIEFT